MIDSCDTSVACWSEDGQTFVVKDPSKFEKEIIPQFFKHSKFSSFVRQLNFYSFRKIKYADTIRLDPKLEAATANFWRFKHENFQRGKPGLLNEIRRMNGHHRAATAHSTTKSPVVPLAATSNEEVPDAMKNELDTLKKKIEEMNKNMSALTTMVQKVSITKDDESTTNVSLSTEDYPAGNKRKMNLDLAVPDGVGSNSVAMSTPITTARPSLAPPNAPAPKMATLQLLAPDAVDAVEHAIGSPMEDLVRPDEMMSTTMYLAYDKLAFPDQCGSAADDALIDLCHVGGSGSEDDTDMPDITASHFLPDPSSPVDGPSSTITPTGPRRFSTSPTVSHSSLKKRRNERADPALMERLAEALAVLPKAMQEQIVERLIKAITTTDIFAASPSNLVPSKLTDHCDEVSTAADGDESTAEFSTAEDSFVHHSGNTEDDMKSAAATLSALLNHYSAAVKKHSHSSASNAPKRQNSNGSVNIPVIPVHA